jgi:hypothetical protein
MYCHLVASFASLTDYSCHILIAIRNFGECTLLIQQWLNNQSLQFLIYDWFTSPIAIFRIVFILSSAGSLILCDMFLSDRGLTIAVTLLDLYFVPSLSWDTSCLEGVSDIFSQTLQASDGIGPWLRPDCFVSNSVIHLSSSHTMLYSLPAGFFTKGKHSSMAVVVHSVHCISIRRRQIDLNEMFVLYRHWWETFSQWYDWSDIKLSSKSQHNGVRTSAVQELRLWNYLLLFLWTVGFRGGGGGLGALRIAWCYDSTPSYRLCSWHWRRPLCGDTLASEYGWQQ